MVPLRLYFFNNTFAFCWVTDQMKCFTFKLTYEKNPNYIMISQFYVEWIDRNTIPTF